MSGMGSGSGHGDPVLGDDGFGGNAFTYGKLFHLLIGNCFISCQLLMGNTSGRTPKFESIGYFSRDLVTIALLIEIFHMVPFVPVVHLVHSQSPLR